VSLKWKPQKFSYTRKIFLHHIQLLMLNTCPKMNNEVVFYLKFSDFLRKITTLRPFELLVRAAHLVIKNDFQPI